MSETSYVKSETFRWTIGIIVSVLLSVIGVLYNKVDAVSTELDTYKSEQWEVIMMIKEDVAITKTNVNNIKDILSGFESN